MNPCHWFQRWANDDFGMERFPCKEILKKLGTRWTRGNVRKVYKNELYIEDKLSAPI